MIPTDPLLADMNSAAWWSLAKDFIIVLVLLYFCRVTVTFVVLYLRAKMQQGGSGNLDNSALFENEGNAENARMSDAIWNAHERLQARQLANRLEAGLWSIDYFTNNKVRFFMRHLPDAVGERSEVRSAVWTRHKFERRFGEVGAVNEWLEAQHRAEEMADRAQTLYWDARIEEVRREQQRRRQQGGGGPLDRALDDLERELDEEAASIRRQVAASSALDASMQELRRVAERPPRPVRELPDTAKTLLEL